MKLQYKGPLHGYNMPRNNEADPANVTPETFFMFLRGGEYIDVPNELAADLLTLTENRFKPENQAEADALFDSLPDSSKSKRKRRTAAPTPSDTSMANDPGTQVNPLIPNTPAQPATKD